jgi:molybdopterin synthase catalytic subunit
MATKWLFSLHFQAVQNKEHPMGTVMESKVRIQREDFSVTDEIEAIKKSSGNIGGIVVFLGTGRELSKGQNISKLNFEHYPKMAEKKLEELRLKAIDDHKIIDMSIIHRIGEIDIGENIVLIVAAGEHRKEAFSACEWAITELKRTTPIWKRETTSTGEVWVQDTP